MSISNTLLPEEDVKTGPSKALSGSFLTHNGLLCCALANHEPSPGCQSVSAAALLPSINCLLFWSLCFLFHYLWLPSSASRPPSLSPSLHPWSGLHDLSLPQHLLVSVLLTPQRLLVLTQHVQYSLSWAQSACWRVLLSCFAFKLMSRNQSSLWWKMLHFIFSFLPHKLLRK